MSKTFAELRAERRKEIGQAQEYRRIKAARNWYTQAALNTLSQCPQGVNASRKAIIEAAISKLAIADMPKLELCECAHEWTSKRFGKAKCRVGRCVKVGTGGKRKGQQRYQIWLVWA